MTMRAVGLGCAALLWAAAAHAEATSHSIKGVTIRLPTPKGFCVPNEANSRESSFIVVIRELLQRAGNTTVKIMADCNQLAKRRASGAGISDYIVFYYPDGSANEALQGTTADLRKAQCASLRTTKLDAEAVKQNVADVAKKLKLNQSSTSTEYLGVLDESANGCHFGILATTQPNGVTALVLVNGLGTVVRNKSLYMTVYTDYKGAATTEKGLAFEKAIAAQLDAENP